ncbi:MAG: cysteine desulfurase family protein [Parachlamydiales bacterium]|jgi:cysteine desulfurase
MKDKIYLDNNSTTFCDPQVIEAVAAYLSSGAGNPSSVHSAGQQAKGLFLEAQRKLGSFIKCKPSSIIFTSGGTEAINHCLRGFCANQEKGHILSTNVEHAAVDGTLNYLSCKGWDVEKLSVGTFGAITPAQIEAAIKPSTKLISVIAANNETGVITDISSIAAIAEKHNIPVFFDGVAWLGKLPVPQLSGKIMWSFSGHKIFAPAGIGIAVVTPGIKLESLLKGGHQQQGRRAGTENMAGIVAVSKAVECIEGDFETACLRMRTLRDKFELQIQTNLKNVLVNGEGLRLCNTSNLAFMGVDGESLLYQLDQQGIAASMGSACSAGTLEPSRILLNMGYDRSRVLSSIRFSLSRMTTELEIHQACEIIIAQVNRARKI